MSSLSLSLALVLLCTLSLSPVASQELFAEKDSAVEILTDASFQEKVVKNGEPWLVMFYADWCGHCKQFGPEFAKAAKALEGIAHLGAVSEKSNLKNRFSVTGFPTLKWFGADPTKPQDAGEARGPAQKVVEWVIKAQQKMAMARLGVKSGGGGGGGSSDIVQLDDDTFTEMVGGSDKATGWLIAFVAPWCGHCKSLAPVWEQLATTMKGQNIKIAMVDATASEATGKRFGVSGFPTIKMFSPGQGAKAPIDYEGGRDLASFTTYLSKYLVVESKHLLNHAQFVDTCSSTLCLIAFLPHLLDCNAQCRGAMMDKYHGALKAKMGLPVSALWSQGGDQFEFEEKLNLRFGFPALVVVHMKKGKYGIHRGTFDTDSIASFMTSLSSGRMPLNDLPKEFKLSKADAWDGKDAPPPEEDL